MARLTDLPTELLVHIMRECDNIRSVLKLSSTCQLAHQVWCSNTREIAYAVFIFTRSELEDFLALFKLEASAQQEQVPHESLRETTNLNCDIRQYLRSIESCAVAVQIIREDMKESEITASVYSGKISRFSLLHAIAIRLNPSLLERPRCLCGMSFLVRAYLLIRRLTFGFHHPSTLADAYATLHSLSQVEI
jgi:hypothetical protein